MVSIVVFWDGDQVIVVTHKFVVIHIIACPYESKVRPHDVPVDKRRYITHSIHSHLVDRRTHTAKICHLLSLLLRWLELHLLLRLVHANNYWLRLEGDCGVRLLLPRQHALQSTRAVVVLLLPLLLLNLVGHLKVILRIPASSNMCGCIGLVDHAMAGAARAVVRLVPSV